jgi:hypothetical protein
MAASNKTATTPTADVEEMFGAPAVGTSDDDFADMDDLLGQIEEDDSESWVPTEPGEAIAGVVLKVAEVRSDFAKPGEDPMVPAVTIQTSNGDKYRVIGYGSVLKREMLDADPKVGDKMGFKYFGEKPVRKGPYQGKLYKHYGVIVKRQGA